jgi:flagellar hook-length control protein FliK
VLAFAQAPDGDHRITVTVSPDDLGPVTVRAYIAGDTMRIELSAPTETGRDAIRHILTDLRRDLAAAAPHASLSLTTGDTGSGSSPQGQSAGQAGPDSGPAPRDPARDPGRGTGSGPHPAPRDAAPAHPDPLLPDPGAPASLDLLA